MSDKVKPEPKANPAPPETDGELSNDGLKTATGRTAIICSVRTIS
jgi:hypothetical protein